MSEDAQHRATEFLKGLYAAGRIDEDRFDSGVAVPSRADARAAEPGPAGRMSVMRTTVAARPRRDIIAACASSVPPKIALRACRGWPTTLVT